MLVQSLIRVAVVLGALYTISSARFSSFEETDHEEENLGEPQTLMLGTILPETSLITVRRRYASKIKAAIELFSKGKHSKEVDFLKYFNIAATPKISYWSMTPSPTDILKTLCEDLLANNVASILYLTNSPVYGSNAASAQYLLQLTGYLGIPVIAWNADNMGLEHRVSESQILQMAPSVQHQSEAMLSILKRYDWKKFSVVTSSIAGHDKFVRSVREHVQENLPLYKFDILDICTLKTKTPESIYEELKELATTEARIFLLYSNREEAGYIMGAAERHGMTGKNYVWIVTQSVVQNVLEPSPGTFPAGMLGVYFNTTNEKLLDQIEDAILVFGYGLDLFVKDRRNANFTLKPNLTCLENAGEPRWNLGDVLAKYLRNVSISKKFGRPRIEFNPDGTLKVVELEIMNLNNDRIWTKIGTWTDKGLEITDIVWPGDSPHPPLGVPEKFNLKVTFMEEPPYVSMVPPDNETGECKTSHAVQCRIVPESQLANVNMSEAYRNPKYFMCCSGFCIDLLEKLANDLKFTYDLYRVEDGIWGVLNDNGTWNGLVAEILSHRADMVVTSFKMNSDRQTALDFTVPFLETGIAILVAKRTGIISPKAFLEPFDTLSWLLILLIIIQAAAVAIFIFEWLSPSGYDRKMRPPRDHKFSLFRTYWLVWAILFGAAVNVDCPRGYTARFMSNVWAMFTVVFLAIYTANLAAFMITREEFYDLSGIEDYRLENPKIKDPPFRYGTVPYGNTWAVLKTNKRQLFDYMKKYNRTTVQDGLKAVKKGEMDAFVYDATVLEYLAAQDNECRLLTVGSWYAMTGYGFAFPKKSKYLNMFNDRMVVYKENGDLERLQRFWFQGSCRPSKEKQKASNPLDSNQFVSAFLLLGCGFLLTLFLLVFEHIYFRYIRKYLAKKDTTGCCTLVSLSMGKSLSFRGAVYEAQDLIKHHRCKDPVCDTQLWKARHQLDMAQIKIRQLQLELDKRSPSDSYLRPRDLTFDHVTTNEGQRRLSPGRGSLKSHGGALRISEIETVL